MSKVEDELSEYLNSITACEKYKQLRKRMDDEIIVFGKTSITKEELEIVRINCELLKK